MSVSATCWPGDWTPRPLWSMFERVKDVGHPHEEMLSVYRDHGVVRKEGRTDNFNKTAENRNIYQLVHPGWLVVNRMKAWQGSLGVSPLRGIVSGHYLCFRPRHEEDSNFVNYLLRSDVYATELRRLSRGVRPNQLEIDNDLLRTVPLYLPDRDTQRRLTAFLDVETQRIDKLIETKTRMLELLSEQRRAREADLLWSGDLVQLRRVADLLAGCTFSSTDFGPDVDGPLLIRGVNVGVGDVSMEDVVHFSGSEGDVSRYALAAGDVLVGMDRPFIKHGTRVALVPKHLEGALLVQRVCRIRLSSIDAAVVVEAALSSAAFRTHVEADLTGVSVPHLSETQIGTMAVPARLADSSFAACMAGRLVEIAAGEVQLRSTLTNQINLLQERRRSLITAVVTGEIEVP